MWQVNSFRASTQKTKTNWRSTRITQGVKNWATQQDSQNKQASHLV